MFRRFIQHGSLYLGTVVVSRALDILLLPVYTRLLDKADFGLMDLVLFPVELASIAAGLHLTEATGRLHHATESRQDQRDYATTGLIGEMTGHLAFAVIVIGFAAPVSSLLTGTDQNVFIVRLGGMMTVSYALVHAIQRQFRWELRSAGYAFVRLGYAVCMNAASLLLVYLGWRAAGIVTGHLMAGILLGLFGIYRLRGTYRGRFSVRKALAMARFSVPLIPRHCARGLSLFLTRRILLHFHSLELVGLYGMGARLALTLDIFMNSVSLTLMPLVLAHHGEPGTPGQVARIFRYTAGLGIVGFVVYSLFAGEALLIFTTSEYLPAQAVVPFVFAGRFMSALQIFGVGMWVRSKTRLVGLISVFGILLEIGLNLALVPDFGMMGTAAAACIAGATSLVLTMWSSQHLYPVPYRWPPILYGCLVAAAAVYVGGAIGLPLLPGLFVKGLLVLATMIGVAWCGIIRPTELVDALGWFARRGRV